MARQLVARVRAACTSQAKVFDKAEKLVEKFRAKAEALADEVEPTELRELLYYLVDTVLEKGELPRQGVTQFVDLGCERRDAEAGRSDRVEPSSPSARRRVTCKPPALAVSSHACPPASRRRGREC